MEAEETEDPTKVFPSTMEDMVEYNDERLAGWALEALRATDAWNSGVTNGTLGLPIGHTLEADNGLTMKAIEALGLSLQPDYGDRTAAQILALGATVKGLTPDQRAAITSYGYFVVHLGHLGAFQKLLTGQKSISHELFDRCQYAMGLLVAALWGDLYKQGNPELLFDLDEQSGYFQMGVPNEDTVPEIIVQAFLTKIKEFMDLLEEPANELADAYIQLTHSTPSDTTEDRWGDKNTEEPPGRAEARQVMHGRQTWLRENQA
jgi:hypothetical protein